MVSCALYFFNPMHGDNHDIVFLVFYHDFEVILAEFLVELFAKVVTGDFNVRGSYGRNRK